MKNYTDTVFAHFHHSEIEIPREAMLDICKQGANDEAIDYWQRTCAEIKFPTRENMIEGLGEYGAWSDDELNALNDDELEQKTLWVSAWDAYENERSEA